MAKVTVYVPDQLYERFERYRTKIHLSALLQEVLTNELNLLESTSGVVGALIDKKGMLTRLKREKAQVEKAWFGRGLKEGIAWTRDAHYSEIRLWGEAHLSDLIPPRANDRVPGVMEPYVQEYYTAEDWDYEAFARGWLAGVKQAWKLVRERI